MGEHRLLLECGINSLKYLGAEAVPLADRITRLEQNERAGSGVGLKIIPYAGSSSAHRGGRYAETENVVLPGLIASLNSNGISFIFIMNGGLLFAEDVRPDCSEEKVLETLARGNAVHLVKNKVTITRDALRPYLRQCYPNLDLIASCIQQTSPRESAPYEDKLRQYEYAVVLNQHTTYAFLKPLAAQAGRLIVFLKLCCGSNDITCCFGDYLAHEKVPPATILAQRAGQSFDGLTPSQLAPENSGCNFFSAALNQRPDDLEALIRMGIYLFKVTRAQFISPDELRQLVDLIQRYQTG